MVVLETYLSTRPFCCNKNIAHVEKELLSPSEESSPSKPVPT